jgi:hypothetical protein
VERSPSVNTRLSSLLFAETVDIHKGTPISTLLFSCIENVETLPVRTTDSSLSLLFAGERTRNVLSLVRQYLEAEDNEDNNCARYALGVTLEKMAVRRQDENIALRIWDSWSPTGANAV